MNGRRAKLDDKLENLVEPSDKDFSLYIIARMRGGARKQPVLPEPDITIVIEEGINPFDHMAENIRSWLENHDKKKIF